jgi:D-xylose transport system substrate-binding protein
MSGLVLWVLILVACGGGSGVTTGKKIALLVPETTTARYDTKDMPLFEAKLRQLCSDCQVLYSKAGQNAAQQTQAKTAISEGASVIVLDPVDPAAAAPIVTMAKAAKIPVISYEALVVNTAALDYYVSFDDAAVGALQGTTLLKAMGSKTKPTIVEINGDSGDVKAELFKQGAHSVLDGKVNFGRESSAPGWLPSSAETEMQLALTALNHHVDGVLAANDAIAGGAITAIENAGLKTMPPVTGQGADLAAIQRIVAGEQYMTVYEAIRAEAEAAAQLAYDLAFGVAVPASSTDGKTVNNGRAEVSWVPLSPVAVTRANIESTIVADGFWTAADICTSTSTASPSRVSLAAACAAAGIS